MTIARFAAQAGIRYMTLANWLQKRRKGSGGGRKETQPIKWVEAMVDQSGAGECKLRVEVCGCAVLEIRSEQEAVIAAMFVKGLRGDSGV